MDQIKLCTVHLWGIPHFPHQETRDSKESSPVQWKRLSSRFVYMSPSVLPMNAVKAETLIKKGY